MVNPIVSQVNVSEVSSVIINNSNVLKGLPPDINSSIGTLITIFKTVGIVFVIYLIFLIVKSIFDIIEKRRIKAMHEKIFEMDKKLDRIIGKKGKK